MPDLNEIKKQRADLITSVGKQFKADSEEAAGVVKSNGAAIEALRAQIAELEDEVKEAQNSFTSKVDKYLTSLRFKLQNEKLDQEVAPWAKSITGNQLILGIGDDEYLVVSAPDFTPHLYGPPSQSGHRACLTCIGEDAHGNIILPSYSLAVFGEIVTNPVASEVAEGSNPSKTSIKDGSPNEKSNPPAG